MSKINYYFFFNVPDMKFTNIISIKFFTLLNYRRCPCMLGGGYAGYAGYGAGWVSFPSFAN